MEKKKKKLDDKSRLNFPELEKCSQNVLKIGSNRTIQLESVVMRHRSQIATHAITLPLSVPIQATPSRRTNYKTAHTPSVGACLRFFVVQLHHSGNRRISLMIKDRSKKYSDTTNIVVDRFPYT